MSSTQGVTQNFAADLNLEKNKVPEKFEEGTADAVLLPTKKKLFTISAGENKLLEVDISEEANEKRTVLASVAALPVVAAYLGCAVGAAPVAALVVGAAGLAFVSDKVASFFKRKPKEDKAEQSDKQNQSVDSRDVDNTPTPEPENPTKTPNVTPKPEDLKPTPTPADVRVEPTPKPEDSTKTPNVTPKPENLKPTPTPADVKVEPTPKPNPTYNDLMNGKF
jgi:hypothetical protein